MDQRARMVKTLVCLVVAMTGTSVFLNWLDPTPDQTADALPPSEILRLARAAVTQDVVVRHDRWQQVSVSVGGRDTGATYLEARTQSPAWHFRIEANGRPIRATLWRDQRLLPAWPHTVRIEVDGAHHTGDLSAAQWMSIRELVAFITQAAARDGSTLPVRFEDLPSVGAGIEPPTAIAQGSREPDSG
ncbi:MAG: hypothetical protein IID43_02955 [Planctomycetes bacterium]|nr:hypothetical protein [Planctomycetota bacterium]